MAELYESYNDIFSLVPVKIYRHNLLGDKIYSPLHWHRSLEITIPLTGHIRFNTGSNNFDYGEADWLFINSCELHSCSHINPNDSFTGISIVISLQFIEKWIGKGLLFYNPELPYVTAQIKQLAAEIYVLSEDAPGYDLTIMSKIYALLQIISANCILSRNEVQPLIAANRDSAAEVTEYIEAHYREDLSLEAIAEHFKYSPSYFSRTFKETLGVTFISYLSFVRVSHAAEDIAAGCSNMSACAFNNGFANTKSFISTFKKVYGCTPGAYQTSIQKNL